MTKKKKLRIKGSKAGSKKLPIVEKDKPENPWDFGGIESRDLKKNLGCG